MKLLALTGSLRSHSLNTSLMQVAVGLAQQSGAQVDVFPPGVLGTPVFNADLLGGDYFPAGARDLAQRLLAADGFIIASPEYNHSMPGGLKNVLDWLSKSHPAPFRGKVGLLMSASNQITGGRQGLLHLREVLETLGANVFPELYVLHKAEEAFDTDGRLTMPLQVKHLEHLVANYLRYAQALKTGYAPPEPPDKARPSAPAATGPPRCATGNAFSVKNHHSLERRQ